MSNVHKKSKIKKLNICSDLLAYTVPRSPCNSSLGSFENLSSADMLFTSDADYPHN